MNRRQLTWFLAAEVLAVIVALISFRWFEPRWLATSVAGGTFVALGIWGVICTSRWPDRRRSFAFYMFQVHLWLGSIPLVTTRLLTAGDFNQVRILFMPAPLFHRISETIFVFLILATFADWVRLRKRSV